MIDKAQISAQQRNVMATIDSFLAVTDEYADKTTKYNMPKIYGGMYLYRNGSFSDPQAEYMEDLRRNMDNFKSYVAKFMENHPEIPISAEDSYLDGGFADPKEHHKPYDLKIIADFPNKKNEIAAIKITVGDYRNIPTIKMTFGKKTLYEDRFGKKYEEEETEKRIAKSTASVRGRIHKDGGILNSSPTRKISKIPIVSKFLNWLSEIRD